MKRVKCLAQRVIRDAGEELGLTLDQATACQGALQPLLANPATKIKQQLYYEVVAKVACLPLHSFQIEPFLEALYDRYFSRFDLIAECQRVEQQREVELAREKQQTSDEMVVMNIELPYECRPLKEAKELAGGRGVTLDPTYLD